jgi:hypothetical protein
MLNAFERRLNELAETSHEGLARIIATLSEQTMPAAIWRRALVAAARRPEAFAPLLTPLACSREAMMARELSTALGEFLRTAFATYDPETREHIERAITEIPDHYGDAHPNLADKNLDTHYGEQARDRLLGCLPADQLITNAAKQRIAELTAEDALPENTPPIGPFEVRSSEYTERDMLAEAGVDVDAEPNRRLQALSEGGKAFTTRYQNGSPSAAEIDDVYRPLLDLWAGARSAPDDGVDETQRDHAWGESAEAAEAITRGRELTCDDPAVALAREILIASSTHRLPVRDEASEEQFDAHPSWSPRAPRIEGAAGVIQLALHEGCLSDEAVEAIQGLSRDPVPAVRLQIARRLFLLRVAAPEVMTEICDRIVESDSSYGVLDALLTNFARLQLADLRAREVLEALWTRADNNAPGAQKVRRSCVQLLTDLYIWRGDERAREFLEQNVLRELDRRGEEAREIPLRTRDAQTHGGPGAEQTAVRARAFLLLSALLDVAVPTYEQAAAALAGRQAADESDPDLQRARAVAQLIDTIAAEVFFASGAFDERQSGERRVSREQRERFASEATDVLDKLADVPIPQVVHQVLETLEVLIDIDPGTVFRRIVRVIRTGEPAGYQFDSLAADLFVRLIERYLAEHRTLLQRDVEARTQLVEILDVFVRAGWPQARRLTYGLHELFR